MRFGPLALLLLICCMTMRDSSPPFTRCLEAASVDQSEPVELSALDSELPAPLEGDEFKLLTSRLRRSTVHLFSVRTCSQPWISSGLIIFSVSAPPHRELLTSLRRLRI